MGPTDEEQRWLDEQLAALSRAQQEKIGARAEAVADWVADGVMDALSAPSTPRGGPAPQLPDEEEQAWLDRRISESRLLEQAEAWARSVPSPPPSPQSSRGGARRKGAARAEGMAKPHRKGFASTSYARQMELLSSTDVRGALHDHRRRYESGRQRVGRAA